MRDNRAAAAAEMALIMPMMFALIFTTFEGGNYLLTEHRVLKSAREGARFAGRLNYSAFDCASGAVVGDFQTSPQITNANAIRNVMRYGNPEGTGRPRFTLQQGDDFTVTLDCPISSDTTTYHNNGIYRERGNVPRVLVNARISYNSILGLLGFDTSSVVVRGQAQAAVMGV
ncbi:TadE/TadG family type IV pilus assembly protein [Qipengyuania atrilutea]|uniref:Pilus assembly protein n=1 Tax=Qipengyuania atrilutea TaxID=2744473 RepID=A0A850GZA1_9SPHN|nr:TadE/TadG family type IV pilus assembly protein [Actirhodobacter atriluteus]NVD43530.1 pilus assembly protein [Actirhodobacter atriluteus]